MLNTICQCHHLEHETLHGLQAARHWIADECKLRACAMLKAKCQCHHLEHETLHGLQAARHWIADECKLRFFRSCYAKSKMPVHPLTENATQSAGCATLQCWWVQAKSLCYVKSKMPVSPPRTWNATRPAGCTTLNCWWVQGTPFILAHAQGWPEPYMYTVYGRICGGVSAKSTVYTLYKRMYVCFCPTLLMLCWK